ncbi:hypothetical protein [Methylobacterium radiodurans]|nr:hypothetical protein [Methylobacterium radiodurans]
MNPISGWVDATSYQSVFQLGVAVTLTYLIAGPKVSEILRETVADMASLKDAVDVLARETSDAEMEARRELLEWHGDVLRVGAADAVKVNPSTATYYVVAPMALFCALLLTSLLPSWPAAVAITGSAVTAILIFMDPVRVVWNARDIRTMTELIRRIAGTLDPHGDDAARLAAAKVALIALRLGNASLKETIATLKELNDDGPARR